MSDSFWLKFVHFPEPNAPAFYTGQLSRSQLLVCSLAVAPLDPAKSFGFTFRCPVLAGHALLFLPEEFPTQKLIELERFLLRHPPPLSQNPHLSLSN